MRFSRAVESDCDYDDDNDDDEAPNGFCRAWPDLIDDGVWGVGDL